MPGTVPSAAASSQLILTITPCGCHDRGEETEAQTSYRQTARRGSRAEMRIRARLIPMPVFSAPSGSVPRGVESGMTKTQTVGCSSRPAESGCLWLGPRSQKTKASWRLPGLREAWRRDVARPRSQGLIGLGARSSTPAQGLGWVEPGVHREPEQDMMGPVPESR